MSLTSKKRGFYLSPTSPPPRTPIEPPPYIPTAPAPYKLTPRDKNLLQASHRLHFNGFVLEFNLVFVLLTTPSSFHGFSRSVEANNQLWHEIGLIYYSKSCSFFSSQYRGNC